MRNSRLACEMPRTKPSAPLPPSSPWPNRQLPAVALHQTGAPLTPRFFGSAGSALLPRCRQSSFSVQNLGDASARANDLLQVPPGKPLLLHTELDRLDGVGLVHRIVFSFIGIKEHCEHIETVAVARSCLRAPKALNLLERGLIISLGRIGFTSPAMLHLFHINLRSPCACRSI